ncbi:MAG: hypothetical protein M1541_08445 [Acidobacteria bacterium]|nr:hypothetical protein [Acidobacteriota bacterium]
MKNCPYCSRENGEDAADCLECGTALRRTEPAARPLENQDEAGREWLGISLRTACTILLIGGLYLLSFGPVRRYCGTVITTGPAPSGPGISTVYTVRYPAWVSTIYFPAFLVASASGYNGLYGRYLQWWVERPGPR